VVMPVTRKISKYYLFMHKTFLSCDWGTSSFRLRLIDGGPGKVVAESLSDEGISRVYGAWKKNGQAEDKRAGFYFSVIYRHIQLIEQKGKIIENGIPIIISGMASSNIGMVELPYTVLPFLVDAGDMTIKKITGNDFYGFELQVISGARTDIDVMRGEETQLLGCAEASAGRELFIFTGTHSKHVLVESNKAIDLKTYMTGELFKLLSEHSVLASSVDASGEETDENENEAAFEQGVENGATHNLLHSIFRVRTNQLLRRFSAATNYHYLSGLLIGAELADVKSMQMEKLVLVGEERLMANYLKAFTILTGANSIKAIDAGLATIQGHIKIYKRLYG